MNRLNWRTIASTELAQLLKGATLDDSRAVGASTVYQLSINGRDVLAVSLPDGQAVVVEVVAPLHTSRRRIEPTAS